MTAENDARYALPPKTTIHEAEELIALAKKPVEGLTIDAAEVETIEAVAAISIACAASAYAERSEKIVVEKPSGPFVDAFSDLGLFEDMMKMEFR